MKKRMSSTIMVSIAIFSCCVLAEKGFSQSNAQQIMQQIYNRYDSVKYISFDVKYTYGTDTVNGDFRNDAMNGSYTMAGKKAFYTIGDIEFMQNDSFFISVYNKDKFIIVSDPKSNSSVSELPMKPMIDSIIQAYSQHYSIQTYADSVTGTITFERADSLAQFDKFVISYDVASNFLNSIRYDFEESQTSESDDSVSQLQTITHKKYLAVEFSNYRIDNFSENIYSPYNYIFFENGVCKPVSKYKNFKVYYSRSPIRNTNIP